MDVPPQTNNTWMFPQIRQQPDLCSLRQTLATLSIKPSSFIGSEEDDARENPQTTAYLTSIVACSLEWLPPDDREEVWELAAKCLAQRAGRSALGSIQRSVSVPRESASTLHFQLHEPGLTEDLLGHKTWVGAFVLAKRLSHLIRALPILRVLELGAGTGLAGMTAAALLNPTSTVHLTDLSAIVPNLQRNLTLNQNLLQSGVEAFALDWNHIPNLPKYDLILVADLLYAPENIGLVATAIKRLLGRNAWVISSLPFRNMQRDYHAEFAASMEAQRLSKLEEGDDIGVEDWYEGDQRQSVRCWWCLWHMRS